MGTFRLVSVAARENQYSTSRKRSRAAAHSRFDIAVERRASSGYSYFVFGASLDSRALSTPLLRSQSGRCGYRHAAILVQTSCNLGPGEEYVVCRLEIAMWCTTLWIRSAQQLMSF